MGGEWWVVEGGLIVVDWLDGTVNGEISCVEGRIYCMCSNYNKVRIDKIVVAILLYLEERIQ
jgi:hypothetical protein